MIFQKNKHGNMIFLQMPRKDGLTKKNRTGIWPFLYYLERWVFFPRKICYFFFGWKMKDGHSQEVHGNMIFSVYMYRCYKYDITLLQKKSKMIFFQKNTVTGDWHSRSHSRKNSNDSLYFYGDLHRRFHILLSSEKKKRNLMYRIETWLLLQIICLEIFYSEESSILWTIQSSGVVSKGVLERQLRELFVH